MTTLPPVAELRRCPTCDRWGGWRRLREDGRTVELHPTDHRGPCREGPWHDSPRGPRNACGQWVPWIGISGPGAGAQPPPSPPSSAASTSSASPPA